MPHVPHRHEHTGLTHALWAICASVVVVFVFLAALGAFEPEEVIEVTIVVVVLAAVLLAHEWRQQFRDETR
jgi:heme A synthase